MLLDLAQFQNVQQNAQMGFTGNHMVGNLNTGVKSQTQFKDTADGQFSQVKNTNNMGAMSIQGNHQFENYTNNGQATVLPRAFNKDGSPAQLMMLEEIDLEDLAAFQNIQQNAQMDLTGTHMVKNINTGEKSTTNFNDHKDGQFVTVANATNGGKMNISGNHQFENFTNNGVANAMPRQFMMELDGEEYEVELEELDEDYLEDLAQFNNYNNGEGGVTSITGTHAFKNMNNAKGGKVMVNDHKDGQFATFGNTNNAGDMQVSGLHQFDNTQNTGNFVAQPRQFGLMDLATFNNFINKEGGNVSVTGTHAFKNIKNEKKGNFIFNDHKAGQFSAIENFDNAGKASFSGNHAVKNQTNSGDVALIPRKFDKDGKPVKELLLDLAMFNNFANQDGGVANITGTHAIKNLSNTAKGQVIFNDHKDGQFATVGNTTNAGKMSVSGLHAFDNVSNTGNVAVIPRAFDEKGNPVKQILLI